MRIFALIAAIVAFAALVQFSSADQNPAPLSVGLGNFSTFTVGTSTSYNILPRNLNRAGLIIQNTSPNLSVIVKPGSAPANTTDGLVLAPGQIWMPEPPLVDAIYGISASATVKVIMMELVK